MFKHNNESQNNVNHHGFKGFGSKSQKP